MRVVVLILVLLAPVVSRADDAQRDLVVEYKRLATELAQGGNCEGVRDLGDRVREADPTFFATEFAVDPVLAPCLPPPSSPAPIAPIDAPAPLAPPSATPVVDREPVPAAPIVPGRPAVPPLDGGRIVGEVLVGGLTGLVGFAGGALVGALLCVDQGGDLACLGSIALGAYFGGAVMFGLGVYAVGNAGEQTGSMGAAILGSVIGAGIGIGALFALDGSSGVRNDELIALALIGGPVVGGVLAFNSTRRWKRPKFPAVGSLLRLDRDGVSLGVPIVVHGEQRGVATTAIPLLSGSF